MGDSAEYAVTKQSYRHHECNYLAPLYLLKDGSRVWFCNKCGGGGADIMPDQVVGLTGAPAEGSDGA